MLTTTSSSSWTLEVLVSGEYMQWMKWLGNLNWEKSTDTDFVSMATHLGGEMIEYSYQAIRARLGTIKTAASRKTSGTSLATEVIDRRYSFVTLKTSLLDENTVHSWAI